MTEPATETILATRIILERRIGADGYDEVTSEFIDGAGGKPRLVEILGMLEVAKASALMGDACDCDDE